MCVVCGAWKPHPALQPRPTILLPRYGLWWNFSYHHQRNTYTSPEIHPARACNKCVMGTSCPYSFFVSTVDSTQTEPTARVSDLKTPSQIHHPLWINPVPYFPQPRRVRAPVKLLGAGARQSIIRVLWEAVLVNALFAAHLLQ